MRARPGGRLVLERPGLNGCRAMFRVDVVERRGDGLTAILSLEGRDVLLDDVSLRLAGLDPEHAPHGAVRWRAEHDKNRQTQVVAVTRRARWALERRVRGDGPLFPGVDGHRAAQWLKAAERRAGLDPLDGSLFHTYRRTWAYRRQHLPDVEVAYAGGWRNPDTMRRCYQQPGVAAASGARGVTRAVLAA